MPPSVRLADATFQGAFDAPRRKRSKYLFLALVAFRQALGQRGELLGRCTFFAVLLFIFSRLWRVVLAEATGLPFSASQMIWYLAVTEWVLLSLPELHLRLEADVRSGEIAYLLPRPVSYLGSRLAEAAGIAAARLLVLGTVGLTLAWLASGRLPAAAALVVALPAGLLATQLGILFLAAIGLLAVWLQDVSPIYWLWQKLAFVLGGLLLPLEIYPHWLQTASAWTPFQSLLHGAARWVLAVDGTAVLEQASRFTLWTALTLLGLLLLNRRALAELEINGG